MFQTGGRFRRFRQAAEGTLALFWPRIQQSPGGFASLLRALEEALRPPEIVILRGPTVETTDWLARLGANPQRLLLALPNDLGDLPAALGKPTSDRVNAWVCRGVSCSAPTANIEALIN